MFNKITQMKKIFFLLLSLMLSVSMWAQTTVKGVVLDSSNQPVVGAEVMQVGNRTNGAATAFDGSFSLSVPSNASLEISCIGYVTQFVALEGKTQVTVIMKEDSEMLNDVVIVAFGQQTKESFTGSAGTMKSEDLAKVSVSNPAQALSGKVAGVQLNNSTGQFGSAPSITIRGVGSISSDTQPLIIVDGMPFDGNLNLISSNDIETMTVLKDAASNALYGARGANGVIMITTKQGKAGNAKVTVDAKWGYNSNAARMYKTTDTKGFYETYYKMLYNEYTEVDGLSASDAHKKASANVSNTTGGVGPGIMVYTVPSGQDFILADGTMNPAATMGNLYTSGGQQYWLQADDWAKEGLQNGFRQEYNVSAAGAKDNLRYMMSIGYLDQDGIQENQSEQRITARIKGDYQAKKWLKIGGNFSYTKYDFFNTGDYAIGSSSIWSIVKTQAPVYPVYMRGADKSIMIDQFGEKMYDFARHYDWSRANGMGGNTIFSNKYESSESDGNAFTINGYADFKILPELTFSVNANIYDYDRRGTSATSPFVDHYLDSTKNGTLSKSSTRTFTLNAQQILNYNRIFGKHDVSAMLGHEYYDNKYDYLSASGFNFGVDGAHELDALLQLDPNPSSNSSEYNNEGYFFRGMYNYDGKYYGSLSFRRDASSRFDKDHRWGNFWSVGGAWIISKEDFFNVPWVNSLKYKASVGSQGNDNIGEFLYADSYSIVNSGNQVAYQFRQKGTKDITWETNTNFNTGFEFELFKSSLTGSIDYFYRKTSDMLFALSTPPSIGYTSYWMNMGDMRNTGVELDLHYNPINTQNVRWDIDFNISYCSNKVLTLPEKVKTVDIEGYKGYVNVDPSFAKKYYYYVAEGLPLYTWYLKKYAGVDEKTGEALYYKDIVDANGNVTGVETTNDSSNATDYLIGDALAKFNGGFGTSLRVHNFDLSATFTYQLGGRAYDYNYQVLMHTGSQTATNWHTDILKAWTPTNTKTDVPRLRYSESYSQTATSDRFLVNASYLNVQNVNVGYTLPKSLTERANIESVRVYVSGDNLFLLSARRGFDPRQFLMGYSQPEYAFPIRTVSGGVTITL
jgi:TonB-linked outer membrane protein, SusC/RagA family/TonB-dependent outer membrane receptor, SusC/RagA subfamily, signature region